MHATETLTQQALMHLRTRLLVMMATAGIALESACDALAEGNIGGADAVIEDDAVVNSLEEEIDELALSLLARHQPVAQDLRFTVAALRVVGEVERIADEAASIAGRVVTLRGPLPSHPLVALRPLMERAQFLYREAEAAFREADADRAEQICRGENESMQMEVACMQRSIVPGTDAAGPQAEEIAHAILVCRALGRVCRRSANIAEQVNFIVHGVNKKHR